MSSSLTDKELSSFAICLPEIFFPSDLSSKRDQQFDILASRFFQKLAMKYILVTGGVISGIGKGVIASSLGTILKSSGVRVTSIKIDPYINIDAGTFSPYEHGKRSQVLTSYGVDKDKEI